MKKFKFRLERLLRQRKIELDIAQKEYLEAQAITQTQLNLIKKQYADLDDAREKIQSLEIKGGPCMADIDILEEYISGQKIRIDKSRHKARELMQISENKHEILIEKMQMHKIIVRLKEKKEEEYKQNMNKKIIKEFDDINTMRTFTKTRDNVS